MRLHRHAAVLVAVLAIALSSTFASAKADVNGAPAPPVAAPAASSPTPVAAPASDADDGDATAPALDEGTFSAPRGERRWLTLSYNPFTLHVSRYGGNVELLVASHHVLEGTLYYADTVTNEDSNGNRFRGWGGELGYRYYTGHDGPRGFFVGPSLLLAVMRAIPARGETIDFLNYGIAVDAGYQAIIADRWVLGLGVGLQYNRPNKTFPQQEVPASIYANAPRGPDERGGGLWVRPRLLLALGFAF